MSNQNESTNDIAIILTFKDKLNEKSIFGLPLGHYSLHIWNHFKKHEDQIKNIRIKREFKRFYKELIRKEIDNDIILDKNFTMWGWWKKYGENFDLLFEFVETNKNGKQIDVFLYNQYANLIYKTKLHKLLYIPELDYVQPFEKLDNIDESLKYYNQMHLCGAFFNLEIENNENMALRSGKEFLPKMIKFDEIFNNYTIHPSSFNYGKNESKNKFSEKEKTILELIFSA